MNSFYSRRAGCSVRWQDLPGSGDPVVFIHGLGCASSYEYPRVVCDPNFGARRAILIDLPGSGYSDKPEHYSYKTGDQARVVAELLDNIGVKTFWLYGHSMGGSIAIETAVLMQARLNGLIVSEPNFHAGGGMFSRSIAAQSEPQFVEHGYAQLLAAETWRLTNEPSPRLRSTSPSRTSKSSALVMVSAQHPNSAASEASPLQ